MLLRSVVVCVVVFFSSRRRHTRCALVTGVQTCALPISAVALAWWESSSPLIAPSWQLLARLDRALPMPLLPLHSRASESPASRPNAASSPFFPPKRQRAPTRDCSVGPSSKSAPPLFPDSLEIVGRPAAIPADRPGSRFR